MHQERYYGLDALRGIMMMLGIVLHAATYHLLEAGMGGGEFSMPILLILGLIHQFRMPLFFVLAGFFAAMLVSKYGLGGLYRNRVNRILYPFVLSLVTIVPLTNWIFFSIPPSIRQGSLTMVSSIEQVNAIIANGNAAAEGAMPGLMSFLHLWFLYYLMFFYLAVPVLERALAWLRHAQRESRVSRLISHPWALVLFSAVTMGTLLPFPGAAVAVNDLPFRVNVAALSYYFVFFACGYLFFAFRDILLTCRRHSVTYGILAFLTFVWYAVGSSMLSAGSESLAVRFVGCFFGAVSTWTFIYYLCGLFLNRFNADSARMRYLSQASYWVYLSHMPVVLFMGIVLMNLPLGPFLTFLLNSVITAVICCASYSLFVRGSWISRFLNGKRFDRDGNVLEKTPVQASHA